MKTNSAENHPLSPFLPEEARLLMLGSFPPQRKRWCMDFYYPNFINDMWRIMGLVFFDDRNRFVDIEHKVFRREDIIAFAHERGLAFYDTATAVRRLQDNASDRFLEVVTPTDVAALLSRLPLCHAIVTTGQKATDTLRTQFDVAEPPVGGSSPFTWEGRSMRLFRMPSSSRAYPMKLERKAEFYRRMMEEAGLL
ncbi:MAG: uracil-DNA glycosylase family protein [Paraprevotella sp.]|nr:uracil-DNA glycosylase family protein [Paraprevotella sp.]